MAARRSETFQGILKALRERLAVGAYPAEARLAAADLAAEFGLSPTPMREVLARLCGEGLLEDRRGEGFFLRRLSARDIAALHHLAAAHVRIALAAGPVRPGGAAAGPAPETHAGGGAIAAGDQLLAAWVDAAGSRALAESFARVQGQLMRVRRQEPGLLPGLEAELAALVGAAHGERAALARQFFARRARLAAALAEALDASAARP